MGTTAGLSNKGKPTVVSVEEGFDAPDPPAPRRVRLATTLLLPAARPIR